MRLFVALDITDDIRERIATFISETRPFAPDARWTAPESWHVTLAFIGERSENILPTLKGELAKVQCNETQVAFRGYGFFPHPGSARVFWVGIEAAKDLAMLASEVSRASGVEMTKAEDYHPHLTLARAGGARVSGAPGKQVTDRPNKRFGSLQAELANIAPPDFGSMIAREFYLYRSHLTTHGSTYEKLERFELAHLSTPAKKIS